jgi:hypothetical protein
MDSFEQVVSEILWMEGHWVRTSVKIDLTKDDKVQIGRPSSPRWELGRSVRLAEFFAGVARFLHHCIDRAVVP